MHATRGAELLVPKADQHLLRLLASYMLAYVVRVNRNGRLYYLGAGLGNRDWLARASKDGHSKEGGQAKESQSFRNRPFRDCSYSYRRRALFYGWRHLALGMGSAASQLNPIAQIQCKGTRALSKFKCKCADTPFLIIGQVAQSADAILAPRIGRLRWLVNRCCG